MDAVRVLGGPYDGLEIDADGLFGGRLPAEVVMPSGPARTRHAFYDLDIDARGECYRYARSTDPPPLGRARYVSRN